MISSPTLRTCRGRWRRSALRWLAFACVLPLAACSALQISVQPTTLVPATQPDSGHRGHVRRRAAELAPTSQPASRPTSQPADALGEPGPCQLNQLNIIHLVYELSPQVRAGREAMGASRHALREFRANLSRFEPFTRVTGTANRFPERVSAAGNGDPRGKSGEVVGGIEKQTFEGALVRLEGGTSASRVRYREVAKDQRAADSGSGGLIRGRVEVPFVGSRIRQERVISSAFQESSARQAQLAYLDQYSASAVEALQYYQAALLHLEVARAYGEKISALNTLRENPRVRPDDRPRLDTTIADARVLRDQYVAYHRDAMLSLLAALGLEPDSPRVLEEPPAYVPSKYIDMSSTPEGLRHMVLEAYDNNPRFQVLDNAIRDAEIQRQQAVAGQYDITAYLQGTQFPFGAETFDDRVGGWEVQAGVTVRLNDQRVLQASRLRAEAQIRQFKAQIEAERLNIQRKITAQTATLRSNNAVRADILEAIRQKQAMFDGRSKTYLSGASPMTIDDVLLPLNELTTAVGQLASSDYYSGLAEVALTAAMGEVFQAVGMEVGQASAGK
jgi:outer membrane protein TolC